MSPDRTIRLSALALAAVAALAPASLAPAHANTPDLGPSLRAYAEGRLALARSDPDTATRRLSPLTGKDAPILPLRRALEAAILGGDSRKAEQIANDIPLTPSGMDRDRSGFIVALTRVATAAGRGDWNAYERALQLLVTPQDPSQTQIIRPVLEAYSLAGRGKMDAALTILDAAEAGKPPQPQILEHRATILALSRRWGEAADAYAELAQGAGRQSAWIRLAAASAMLEAADAGAPQYRERAILLLGEGPANDPILDTARKDLRANPAITGRKLGGLPQNAAEGVGIFLLQMSVDLARGRALDPAIAFSRLATFAAPGLGAPWITTAEFLARAGETPLALETVSRVPNRAPWPRIAETQRILLLTDMEEFAAARRLVEGRLKRNDDRRSDWLLLSSIEQQANDRPAAAEALTEALDTGDAHHPIPDDEKSYIHFLRGALLERGGHWPDAEQDLRQAVAMDGNNPLYLNYLGYSLLDRNQNFAEAKALIARAYKAAPHNGAIIDSMGWAFFKEGAYAEAVRLLTRAFAAEPSDPNVAAHLGDALWRTGREFEARHAWNSALSFAGDDDTLRQTLEQKALFGLPPERN